MPPRPAHTYRGARRNTALRVRPSPGTWSSSWYVPKHRANYARGWPTFRQRPSGRYPPSMVAMREDWLEMKRQARVKAKELRKLALQGRR